MQENKKKKEKKGQEYKKKPTYDWLKLAYKYQDKPIMYIC